MKIKELDIECVFIAAKVISTQEKITGEELFVLLDTIQNTCNEVGLRKTQEIFKKKYGSECEDE